MGSAQELARIQRGLSQKIYVLGGQYAVGELFECTMAGLTSTYKIRIQKNKEVSCSCPDFKYHGNDFLCKHLVYFLVKGLHITVDTIVNNKRKFDPAYFKALTHYITAKEQPPRDIEMDDDCPICLERLLPSATTACKTCGKSVHKNCFEQCSKFQTNCVYCRSEWHQSSPTDIKLIRMKEPKEVITILE